MSTPWLELLAPEAFRNAFDPIAILFERHCGTRLNVRYGPAGGASPHSIVSRLESREPADVVILPDSLLREQLANGGVLEQGRVRLMRSLVGMCAHPDFEVAGMSTAEELVRTLLDARSIAYSSAGSGIYVRESLFGRLGVTSLVLDKCIRVAGESVGAVVARGEAQVGFQQVSELLQVPGIRFVGALPSELQHSTLIGAGVAAHTRMPVMAGRFLEFMLGPSATLVFRNAGVEPVEC